MSQDHLELFFCAIRSKSGWNNNPTARQFIAAFKSLLTHAQVKSSGGNSEELQACSILKVAHSTIHVKKNDLNMILDSTDNLDPEVLVDDVDIPCMFDALSNLSEFQKNAVGYISGYVVKMVSKIIKCPDCTDALFAEKAGAAAGVNNFVFQKTRGGLIVSSADVTKICLETEKVFRTIMETSTFNASLKNLPEKIALEVTRKFIFTDIFPTLNEHIKELELDNSHIYKLVKTVSFCYTKIKLNYILQQRNMQSNNLIRSRLSRYIIFRNN